MSGSDDDFVPIDEFDDERLMAEPPLGGAGSSAPALTVLGIGILVVVLLLAGIVALLSRVDLPRHAAASDALVPSGSASSVSSPSSSSTEAPAPTLAAIDGRPGPVAGANFSVADRPYEVGPKRLPFGFAFPAHWDCIYSTKSTVQTTGGYTCFEATGDSRVGGRIGYQQCAAVCTPAEVLEVGDKMYIDPRDWRPIDAQTTFADVTGPMVGTNVTRTRVGMRYVYAPGGRAAPSIIAFAVLTGDPAYRETMLKVLNSVRANAV
ncbi:hypothetical protein GTV32_20910 [Gordonia sp. SID5947]|uniref:hypothetical protein n=1 Tax=Gordonia sp. SID5947 TaxID=2690315 RepID=UPI00136A01E2|nr:hypothetical protein [Gordonia sp. SID5947]MYR08613.1 hypothetical protein [Gordonia sp. SID5947]